MAIALTQILNANLYITSWICLAAVIFIVGDLMGDLFAGPQGSQYGLSQQDPQTGEYVVSAALTPLHYQRLWQTRRGKWFAQAAIAMMVLGAIFCLAILGLGSMGSPLSEFVEK